MFKNLFVSDKILWSNEVNEEYTITQPVVAAVEVTLRTLVPDTILIVI